MTIGIGLNLINKIYYLYTKIKTMQPTHHDNPVLAFFLSVGSLFGVAGLTVSNLDAILGIALKAVSILSFMVAIGYTLWKWRDAVISKNKK